MSGPRGLADLAGAWTLARRIRDARAGAVLRLSGTARFEPAGAAALEYSENGVLTLPDGQRLAAERRHRWLDVPGGAEVLFADGRPFHALRWAPVAAAQHPCGEDRYQVRYDFRRWPVWWAIWRVTGPGKDYLSVSRYRRA